MADQLNVFPYVLAYIVLGIIFILIAKWVYDLMTYYKLDNELTKKDNPAVGTALTGYFIALMIIIAKIVPHIDKDMSLDKFLKDLPNVVIYVLLGIVLLNVSRMIVDKLILYKFKVNKELIDDKNVGTGAVLAGSYVASGLVIAAALAGDGETTKSAIAFSSISNPIVTGVLLSLIFFSLGQATFVLYSLIYSWLSPYKVHEEIEKDNVAAGVAFGGGLVALGIILYRGLGGKSNGWTSDLLYYGFLVAFAFILFPLIRLLVNKIMLPKADLTDEIVRDRNVNAAYLEIVALNMVAAIILFVY
ncbi:MAG TPA: DUF350 domain-containing protein [Spirochaetes bacterium]|nr:DUF350 domain-containing protein [Spirochaetota bacterium]